MFINKNAERLLKLYTQGKQTCRVDYKDTDEIYIYPGMVEINGNFTKLDETLEYPIGSLSVSTWYFVMATYSGKELKSDDISLVTDVPELDREKQGYYSSDGLSRCIGFFLTNDSSEVTKFRMIGNYYNFNAFKQEFINLNSTSFTEKTLALIPLSPVRILILVYCDYNGATTATYWSTKGVSTTQTIGYCNNNGYFEVIQTELTVSNDEKKVWAKVNTSSGDVSGYMIAFIVPQSIFNSC